MSKQRIWAVLGIAAVITVAIGLIGSKVLAQDETPSAEPETFVEEESLVISGGPRGFGGSGLWIHERFGGDGTWLENLAEALGITVDELQAAQEQAFAATVADAVTEGTITQEQADQLLARRALRAYVDHQVILASALGMTVDELEAAFDEGQSLVDLMVEKGLNSEELQAAIQTGYEAAVQRAVTEGAITQEQADQILSEDALPWFDFGMPGGPGLRHGRPGFHWNGPAFGIPAIPDFVPDVPDLSDTGFNG
jgi:hypothetical protein